MIFRLLNPEVKTKNGWQNDRIRIWMRSQKDSRRMGKGYETDGERKA